jgi:hypothetical protein
MKEFRNKTASSPVRCYGLLPLLFWRRGPGGRRPFICGLRSSAGGFIREFLRGILSLALSSIRLRQGFGAREGGERISVADL